VKLSEFEITNFRSVNDSGPIKTGKITALVGRNESGKSNLLRALQSLNPPEGLKALSPIKNFPRHRRLNECDDDTPVVSSTWELSDEDKAALVAVLPRAEGVSTVRIGRRYKGMWVALEGLAPVSWSAKDVQARAKKLVPSLQAAAEKLDDDARTRFEAAITKFAENIAAEQTTGTKWAATAPPEFAAIRKAAAVASVELGDRDETLLDELESLAQEVGDAPKQEQEARNLIAERMPTFVYVDEYPELSGHQNIADYLHRKTHGKLTDADENFAKLCKVAGLDPQELQNAANDPETRNQLVNRASAVITGELHRLWKDRALKVRFNVDGPFLDTFISDPNALYDVEVNLDERSRGFKWFFSFYVSFAADTQGGPSEDAILLLDEPGLYLHIASQGDLLRHFASDFHNQVVYSTHSPYMIPTDNLDAVRTVNISQDTGTTVTNDPTGDTRTLFPLQAALGFHLAQNLFIGPANLIVEGVTDYWIVSCASEYLRSQKRASLPKEIAITPAGGAQKVTYMVALLSSERLHVVVLLDDERSARAASDEMVKSKLIRDENVLFVSESFGATKPAEADIEDLLDPGVYDRLVEESYKAELKGKQLKLNGKIPRIVKRYEEAFAAAGMEFFKTRPARLLLTRMGTDPKSIMTDETCARFEALFARANERFRKHAERGAGPFR
jgi:energy-coupling factor transporter ATP-binding protein EcfA2